EPAGACLFATAIRRRGSRTSSNGDKVRSSLMQLGTWCTLMRRWLVAIAVAVAVCQSAAGQTRRHPKQVSSVKELLALAADPKSDFDYMQVSRFLGTLPAAERQI